MSAPMLSDFNTAIYIGDGNGRGPERYGLPLPPFALESTKIRRVPISKSKTVTDLFKRE